MRFKDREEAGQRLAKKLGEFRNRKDAIVLGLPRGGVPVAFEVAEALNLPLDILVVRKLGVPGQRELAMGAIASGGVTVLNDEVIGYLGISPELIDEAAAHEEHELDRREKLYRGAHHRAVLQGKVVIIVDDGLATGSTMKAAVEAVRRQSPSRIVVAAPVAARETVEYFEQLSREVSCVCELTPTSFSAVGVWYEDFSQTGDDEVAELLQRNWRGEPDAGTNANDQDQ